MVQQQDGIQQELKCLKDRIINGNPSGDWNSIMQMGSLLHEEQL